jgi:hypothetical protein
MKIMLENVRTFSGTHEFPVGPLTVLTGENSAGKTTLLGMMAAVLHQGLYPFDPPFDVPPYSLGSYDTIATNKGGRTGPARQFGLGYAIQGADASQVRREFATYGSDKGRVALLRFESKSGSATLDLEVTSRRARAQDLRIRLCVGGDEKTAGLTIPIGLDDRSLPITFQHTILDAVLRRAPAETRSQLSVLSELLLRDPPERVVSVGPIRAQPERTYSEAKRAFAPDGDHIPFELDRMLSDESERRQVMRALKQFGQQSGLFEGVQIKRLGPTETDPFQIVVLVANRPRNLVDVGYGVSQALPVVVQTVIASPRTTILLQQPEVHLHPRAQAALGSFFCRMVQTGDRRLVVETHSDFIVDRIRQEVASGGMPAEMVSLIFFDRHGSETSVHPLRLDNVGNILDAPDSYREFFFEEEDRLLSRASK